MATEDEGTDDRTMYVLKGTRNPGQRVSRVIVEGTMSDPKRVAVLDGPPVALSEEEHTELSKRYRFRKEGEESERKAAGDTEDDTDQSDAEKRGAQQNVQAADAPSGAMPTTISASSAKSSDKKK